MALRFTTIDHAVKKHLKINYTEYVLMDMICKLSNNSKNKSGWCFMSKSTMAEEINMTKVSVVNTINKLFDRGYLEKKDNGRRVKVSDGIAQFFEYNGKEVLPIKEKETVKDVYRNGKESLPQSVKKVYQSGKKVLPPSYMSNYKQNDKENYNLKEINKEKNKFSKNSYSDISKTETTQNQDSVNTPEKSNTSCADFEIQSEYKLSPQSMVQCPEIDFLGNEELSDNWTEIIELAKEKMIKNIGTVNFDRLRKWEAKELDKLVKRSKQNAQTAIDITNYMRGNFSTSIPNWKQNSQTQRKATNSANSPNSETNENEEYEFTM